VLALNHYRPKDLGEMFAVYRSSTATLLFNQYDRQNLALLERITDLLLPLPLLRHLPCWRSLVTFFVDTNAWQKLMLVEAAALQRFHPGSKPLITLTLPEDVTCLCRVLFQLPIRDMIQSARQLVLSILDLCVHTHTATVVGMGETAIKGIIRCIKKEEDPRNMLITFRLGRFLLEGSPHACFPPELVSRFEGEICKVIEYYDYPIEWTPPAHDPVGISTAELNKGLAELRSTNAFSAYTASQ